jgi:rare lipoprotein A
MRHLGTARVQIDGLTQQQARAEMNETLAFNSGPSAGK